MMEYINVDSIAVFMMMIMIIENMMDGERVQVLGFGDGNSS